MTRHIKTTLQYTKNREEKNCVLEVFQEIIYAHPVIWLIAEIILMSFYGCSFHISGFDS